MWDRYDRLKKRMISQGHKPFNGDIVYAALNAAQGRFHDIIAARRPQPEPGQLFGGPAPGRRRSAEAQHRYQITFRPTPQEKTMIQRLKDDTGADSVAALIEAVLDDYLTEQGYPPPSSIRRPGR